MARIKITCRKPQNMEKPIKSATMSCEVKKQIDETTDESEDE